MTVYTVRFCDKELIANNLRDFAKIAVFAKWYLRSQSLGDGMQCSIQNRDFASARNLRTFNELEPTSARPQHRISSRRPRASVMRKALRSFFYNVFC